MFVRTRRLSKGITFFRDNLFCAQTYRCHDLHFTRSHGVIDNVTIRFAMCHFLLDGNWNRASTSFGGGIICAVSLSSLSINSNNFESNCYTNL